MRIIKLPWLPSVIIGRRTVAITISPFIFIRSDHADNPAVLAHEQVHLDQIAKTGWIKWYWKYATDPVFRKEQEKLGYEVQRKIEAELGI